MAPPSYAAGGAMPSPTSVSASPAAMSDSVGDAPQSPAAPGGAAHSPMPAPRGAPATASTGTPGAKSATPDARTGSSASMLIYAGELQMQVDEDRIAATLDAIIDASESVGGHIAARTDASVVVKVPSARFREALGKMEPLGAVMHRSVTAQDVTDQYHDAEVRLMNLKATRQRLQEFLARAGNIADTLTVERELERVAQEIDVLEGRMHFLKERAAFSEIKVGVSAKPKPPIAKEPPPPPPPPPPSPPPPPPPKRLLDLPVEWFKKLGVNRLLDLRVNVMKLSSIVIASALAITALGAAGCHTTSRLDAPDGFAVLGGHGDANDKDYDWRAASAQGVVLAVRTEKNEPRANVDFWADAIDVRMRQAGYAADAKTDVTSATGIAGKQLRYTREEDRRVYRYWLTVFVAAERVYVIEAGGDKESFDPAEKTVARAVLSVHAS